MDLYDKCLNLKKITPCVYKESNTSMISLNGDNRANTSVVLSDKNYIDKLMYNKVYYISDIHLAHHIYKEFPNGATDTEIKSYIKKVARGLFSKEFVKDIETSWYQPIVIFGGDTASYFEVAQIFYTEFMAYWNKLDKKYGGLNHQKKYVYAILGNHELWEFDTQERCYTAYKKLFDKLGICFLNNDIAWFGEYRKPVRRIAQKALGEYSYVEIKREDDELEYDKQMRYIHNTMIVGGIGFAGYNTEFNANNGIYRDTINREQEIKETQKWEEIYHNAIATAKKNQCALIVLTHNPINDWKQNCNPDCGCIYFNGHSHRESLYHDGETNIHIYANNQVGYRKKKVQLKRAYIYKRMNPFAGYDDGCHEINSSDYLRFYDYMNESIGGNGLVERQIATNNAKFYIIKHDGYCGFFLTSEKGTYICAGGRIKKISKCSDITKFNIEFANMIRTYLRIVSPYRNAQERIAEAVKAFGGDGTIHGCIIDIDFFNHIMLNPTDGAITYYTSPAFGQIKTYGSVLELLADNNKMLEEKYKKQFELSDSTNNVLTKNQIDVTAGLVQIDIKNSIYAISNRMNQLQRLFDKKILRDWNEELLELRKESRTIQLE